MEIPDRVVPVARRTRGRLVALAALCVSLVAAAVIVSAQPLGSPWWTYADADSTYTTSGLNLLAGVSIRYLDHPGLPLEELSALVFGAEHTVSKATGSKQTTLRFVDARMLNLDKAKGTWRGLAIVIYLLGSLLSFLLVARFFGHWSWGLAGGLLWLAAPGLAKMSIQYRPDVALSVLLVVATFLLGRGAERRSAGPYLGAAVVLGLATMVKLHAAGMLSALAILAVFCPPREGWWSELRGRTLAFVRRRLWPLTAIAVLWLTLAVLLNRHWLSYHPDRNQQLAAAGPVLGLLVYSGGCALVHRLGRDRILRRLFDPFLAVLAAAYLVGLAMPITLDVPDGLTSLIHIKDGLSGGGINTGIPAFGTPLDQLVQTPLRQGLLFFVLAGFGAVVGLIRRDALPVAWFVGAAVLGVMAQARLADIHYFAPGYIVSVFGALWFVRAVRPRRAMPLLAWGLVAYAVIPQFQYRDGPAVDAVKFTRTSAPGLTYIAGRLRPGELGLTPSYWPDASTRYFDVVQPYVNYTPEYPYSFVDASTRGVALAAERHLRLRYYTGPDIAQLTASTGTIQLGDIGKFRVRKVAPDVVELLAGPGTAVSP